jgi:hypothetical protein
VSYRHKMGGMWLTAFLVMGNIPCYSKGTSRL